MKKNCWDFKKCKDRTNCSAYKAKALDGIHEGINGGRACWVVAGTMCGGEAQGEFTEKVITCLACDFYRHVKETEEKKEYDHVLLEKYMKGI